jgi:ATP-dependent RNA helicase DeaD
MQLESETLETFETLGLGSPALRAAADLGFAEPTAIQIQAIPMLLAGRDLVAEAPTGTGKTAAYGLPIVEHLDEAESRTQSLVLVPTRELAIQVAEALHGLGKYCDLVTLPVYGGVPYERQLRALSRGVQAVVGTPGRLLDLMARGSLKLDRVRIVVLDEADEMLSMGFIDDIQEILGALPAQRQTALFSATMPPRVVRLAQQHLQNPGHISVASQQAIAPRVRQVYYEIPRHAKPEALARILDIEEPESAIVFVGTRREADTVAEQLNGLGYLAQAIHGEVTQAQRERVLERFRAGRIQLLVGTDVAARGLDIPDVSHVINYDVPPDAESYVHRIGRTGRAGRTGEAVTIITPRERRQLNLIAKGIHRKIQPLAPPTLADVAARRRAVFRDRLLEIVDAGELDQFITLVEDLAETRDVREVAAAALKMASTDSASTRGTPRRGILPKETPAERDILAQPAPEEPAQPRRKPLLKGETSRAARSATDDERPRPARGGRRIGGATAQLFLRVGKRDGVRPADIVGAIANEAGLTGDVIGDIEIFDSFSFVAVPKKDADHVEATLNQTQIRGKSPQARLARPLDKGPASRTPKAPRKPRRA